MKTNLDIIPMNPGVWCMLVSHPQKQSQIYTPSHAVYYNDNKMTFNAHSLECTTGNTLQTRSQLHPNSEICIRCYTREHFMIQQPSLSRVSDNRFSYSYWLIGATPVDPMLSSITEWRPILTRCNLR
jgi:hypothetical protein